MRQAPLYNPPEKNLSLFLFRTLLKIQLKMRFCKIIFIRRRGLFLWEFLSLILSENYAGDMLKITKLKIWAMMSEVGRYLRNRSALAVNLSSNSLFVGQL